MYYNFTKFGVLTSTLEIVKIDLILKGITTLSIYALIRHNFGKNRFDSKRYYNP